MGQEIDLLRNYPKLKRNLDQRVTSKTPEIREVARRFDKEYFDGDRQYGYGGYYYDPRFWGPVIPDFIEHFDIAPNSSVLDVGCGKGFMLYEFARALPELTLAGIDISGYAIRSAKSEVSHFLSVGDASHLPFEDDSFDFVFSINTIHNLDREGCGLALKEISRVSRKGSFVVVDAYRTEEERVRMEAWNLTALTYMSTEEWRQFFSNNGYGGDYFWFLP